MLRHSLAALAALSLTAGAAAADLPRTMIWSAYDVGSSGYTEASAIADGLMRQSDARVRIMPSGTSIGRLLPMKTGRVSYGFLANEVYFAAEALYEFSTQEWGPQDLRVLLGRPAGFGLMTAADAGVETIADLRGKRVARVQANPSVNVKTEAILAFAGLSWDDVEVVEFPSFAASMRGVVEGVVDSAGTVPTGSIVYELEASPRGLMWPPIPADDAEGWARLDGIAPIFEPLAETVGAGMGEDNPAHMIGYRYPMITTYATTSDDEVYAVTKAVVESFDLYKDVTAAMPRWDAQIAGRPVVDAPFHDGAIRYLKEIGVWTDEDQAWNDARLARMQAVQAAWDDAIESALEQQIPGNRWAAFWEEWRAQHLN